jgi:hypothetical protein
MGCDDCIIIGNAPPADAVKHYMEAGLFDDTPLLKSKFAAVYAIYEDDEANVTQGMLAFVNFLEMFIGYNTSPDPIV